mgnify:CR=1 FL=1
MKKSLVILGLVTASLLLVAAKYDHLLETAEKTVKSSECNECHKQIYEEWSKNFHARAYVNDPFKKASKNYGEEECVLCHAAQDIQDEKNLKARTIDRQLEWRD